jgi:hypothetical protein
MICTVNVLESRVLSRPVSVSKDQKSWVFVSSSFYLRIPRVLLTRSVRLNDFINTTSIKTVRGESLGMVLR